MEHLLHAPHQHLVFFTHNEQSHITPMFALARALASRGLQITCALPASSYASYCSNNNIAHNNATSEGIQVQPVAASSENSDDDLLMLQTKLQEGLIELMQRLQPPPSFLIADIVYFPWSQDVANRLGVTLFLFGPFLATTFLITCHLPELLQKGFLPFQPGTQDKVIDFIPGLMKGFRLGDVPLDYLRRSSAELEAFNFLGHCKACAGLVLPSTSYALEVEAEALDALTAHGLRVYPVAPMLQCMDWYNNSTLLYREDDKCMSFLDKHPSGSVVYASFGGIISLTKEEITELALGLEACGQPFLCVIRRVDADGTDVMAALPPGFLERINDRGRIISWAPQMAVLSHPSVGCFLSHCGLGSVLEAIWTGVPLIGGFYKISDQNTVFRVMTDVWRVALPLNMLHSSHLRKSIEEAIKEILQKGAGTATHAPSIIKSRIVQLRDVLTEAAGPSGISCHHFEQFVDDLLSCSPVKQAIP